VGIRWEIVGELALAAGILAVIAAGIYSFKGEEEKGGVE